MEYNGSTPATLVANVSRFDLIYSVRTMTGTGFAKGVFPPDATVVFVSGGTIVVDGDETTYLPTAQEQLKIALIESWGYAVEMIHCTQSKSEFDAAVADAKVAYVSLEISEIDLNTKLRSAPIGIVIEKIMDDFGIAEDWLIKSRDEINIIDNSHYITSPFSPGLLTYLSSLQPITVINALRAPDCITLAEVHNTGSIWRPALGVVDTGGELVGGGTAKGRRVQLPWGDSGFDVNALTDDGKLIMRRAIEWASDSGVAGSVEMYVNDIAVGWRKEGPKYFGQATVWAKDDTGADVVGAIVTGAWSGAVTGTDQGVTGSDGKAMLESPGKPGGGTFTFTVTDVAMDGYSYNPALNWETSDSIAAP